MLSFVDISYPNSDEVSWKKCVGLLKSKGHAFMTDLMILPARIIQGKFDASEICQIRQDCFGTTLPKV